MPFFDLKGAELAAYRSTTPEPRDIDAFWQATLAEARQHPLAAQFTPVDAGLALVDCYDVTFNGFGGHPIKGWYLKPRGVQSGLAAVVKFIGYGGGRGFLHEHLMWPASGRALLVMDTRGQGSTWSRGDTPDPSAGDPAHPGFMTRGLAARESYYYRRVYTDGVRAIEAALTRPEIDPAKIAVVGGSQGGGIAIAVAGLAPAVAAAMPDVPFLSDFRRAVGLAARDPYGEIVRYLAVHREKIDQSFTTLGYFDGVNFARRAMAAALFSVAEMDDICPPSTVYAAFNAWGGTKAIESYTYNNHEGGGPYQDRRQLEWLSETGL
jgi:cephalosporin-C deacetylase